MARALIVGCGCRGRMLGERLLAEGWQVRGTSRVPEGVAAIGSAGLEGATADPRRPGTILELVGDVAVVHWLLGSASGTPQELRELHGASLERLLERLVETPVRGLVFEAAGSSPAEALQAGAAAASAAGDRWRIPLVQLQADPTEPKRWLEAALAVTRDLLAGRDARI